MIPTAITRYREIEGEVPFCKRFLFNRSITLQTGERLTTYPSGQLAIRWSSLAAVIKRLLRR